MQMKEYIGRALLACEESQEITKALRARGWEAFSCDLQDCSGGRPEWHIKGDVRHQLKVPYDLVIFHPDCTRLTNTVSVWLEKKDLWAEVRAAAAFFNLRHEFNAPFVATENPIPHKYAKELIGMYDQLIQPYHFGHPERKGTCFWLKGLPPLVHTKNVYKEMLARPKKERNRIQWIGPSKERAKLRAKTFPGIAEAIADQWTNFYINEMTKDL